MIKCFLKGSLFFRKKPPFNGFSVRPAFPQASNIIADATIIAAALPNSYKELSLYCQEENWIFLERAFSSMDNFELGIYV